MFNFIWQKSINKPFHKAENIWMISVFNLKLFKWLIWTQSLMCAWYYNILINAYLRIHTQTTTQTYLLISNASITAFHFICHAHKGQTWEIKFAWFLILNKSTWHPDIYFILVHDYHQDYPCNCHWDLKGHQFLLKIADGNYW